MAATAHRNQVSLLHPGLVDVVPAERKLGESFDVADMMHQIRGISLAADLAVPTVIAEDCSSKLPPLRADIERVNIACGDQAKKPLQKTLSHTQNKKSLNHAQHCCHGLGSKASIGY